MRARRGGGVLALAIALGSPSRASAEPSAPPSIDGGSSIAVSADATNADGIERAEAYAAAAYEAYSREDYAQAVALYLEAYAASPTAAILYNVARIYDTALHDATLAIRHYERYVSAPDADVYRAARARARLAQLRAARDAALAPERPAPAPVATGSAGSTGSTFPAPAPPHPAAAGELDARFWTPLRVGAVVAGSVGLVAIGLGAGFGVAALSDASTAREYCDGPLCSSQRGIDATHAASKNADIATAGFALGGALLAVGGGMLWAAHGSGSSEIAGPRLSPIASSSQLGLAYSGSW